MSKLYLKYLELKENDCNKYYLFKSGNFYIFISDDAKKISSITTLNVTNLTKDIIKCGFPLNSLDKYINIFKNMNINVEIIENVATETNNSNKIIKKLRRIDINTITPLKAINILNELVVMSNE